MLAQKIMQTRHSRGAYRQLTTAVTIFTQSSLWWVNSHKVRMPHSTNISNKINNN